MNLDMLLLHDTGLFIFTGENNQRLDEESWCPNISMNMLQNY